MAFRRFQELKLNTSQPAQDTIHPVEQVSIENQSRTREDAISSITHSGALKPHHDTSDQNSQFGTNLRARGKSITFDTKVKLENGNNHNIGSPLPKGHGYVPPIQDEDENRSLEIPHRSRPRSHSDAETKEYDPRTGEPLDRRHGEGYSYHTGEMRHPLLQSTVDELAAESSRASGTERIPSLTSDITASPLSEAVRTPVNGDALSPLSPSSPVTIASTRVGGLPGRKSVSQRSFGSLGSVGRRHTVKSAGSSLSSPARSWLSQWQTSSTVREPDPDEEGQEIRDPSGPIYIIGRQIGYGGFSVVKEATTLEGDMRMVRAVKIVRKQVKDLSESDNEKIQHDFEREVDVWRYLNHRYVLPLIAAYNTDFATFCITKLNRHGTLFDLMRSRRKLPKHERGLPTHLAKRYTYQLASAIRYLHEDARAVHRDIKPENCLLDMSDPSADEVGGNILLCDFGMADWIQSHENHSDGIDRTQNIGPSSTSTAIQGSLEYAAPEMFSAGQSLYSTAADMWAFGCCVFTILTCERPFTHEYQPKLVMMIQKGSYDADVLANAPAILDGGEYAKELVEGCLDLDVDARLDVGQVLGSCWLDGCEELYKESDSF